MAIKQLSDARADGTSLGQSASDKLNFYGLLTPVVQAAIAVAGTDAATTQVLANDLRVKLIALGLVV